MQKEERILRFKYPGRTSFSREELLEARRVLSKDESKDDSGARLPSRFVAVGDEVEILGRRYKCVLASGPLAWDACAGCDLRDKNCTSKVPQCSPFDRRDHKRVWFVLSEGSQDV